MESSVKNESEHESLEELKESLGVMPVENRASIDQAAHQTKEGKEVSPSKRMSTTTKDKCPLHEDDFKNIAQDKDQKQCAQSQSESTNSGIVSPSSCSVSSQDSRTPRDQAGLEEDKREGDFPPGENETKKLKAISQTNPVHKTSKEKIHTSSPTSRPPSGKSENTHHALPKKPSPKSHNKRPTGRKRSNSVPMYTASESQKYALPDAPASSISISSSKASQLRRGKWTVEEETYVARVINDFNNGFLDAPAGTTLRTYLSDKLNCDPMRITKKFTGDSCIGKRVFHPAARTSTNAAMIDKAQSELETLEKRWRKRLDMQRKEADKKQAASVAASAAAAAIAAASAPHLHDPTSALIRLNASALPGNRVVVTRTASWLDRANAILSNRRIANEQLSKQLGQRDEVKKEMQEVKKLIQEGPIIQKSSEMLRETSDIDPPSKRKVSDDRNLKLMQTEIRLANHSPSRIKKGVVKRMRKSFSTNNLDLRSDQIRADFNLSTGEAEDAASFLGFITSVREEAASGATSTQSPKK